jgi:ferredoxin--NADP+ reductase
MTTPATTPALRVAIVGSGPSGFYAAEHLQKKLPQAEIDMFDRLPTPYGLVRGGVAPDHQKIKLVTKVYDRIASQPGFRFFGNVTLGTDLSRDDLLASYHAVIYAVGASTDRTLGIPGEALHGSHAATEFVGWYNGHPDFRGREFDLFQENVAVIGMGNVAVDVVRILARTTEELAKTDIAGYALEALAHSRVRNIYMLGRRGPVQGAFTNPELKELGQMPGADIVVHPEELTLDPVSADLMRQGEEREGEKNLHTLQAFAAQPRSGKPRSIHIRFLVSPLEIRGDGAVRELVVGRNRLVPDQRGGVRAEPTGESFTLPVGLVFRSVGYLGVAQPGLPFDSRQGIIPNQAGRVSGASSEYVVGWIKRGPTGVIGTNKPDAVETVDALLEDTLRPGASLRQLPTGDVIPTLLQNRGVRAVSYDDWRRLDEIERARGQPLGRPRLKLTSVSEMLEALDGPAAMPAVNAPGPERAPRSRAARPDH